MEQSKTWIDGSDNIVFFDGVGVSTESGAPDLRSEDGPYRQQYQYPPEMIISHSFYMKNPEEFCRLYKNKMILENTKPNPTHLALARLEKQRKLKAVITQSIDNLHQATGSREALELYDPIHRDYRTRYGKFCGLDVVTESDGTLKCSCGGIVKPDVVLYEEGLGQGVLQKAVYYISHAGMLIVGGTSLTMHPTAGLADRYRRWRLVLASKTVTPMGSQANLMINDKLGEVLGSITGEL